jgi:hypothetical protein
MSRLGDVNSLFADNFYDPRDLRGPGHINYSLYNIHSLVSRINSFVPYDEKGKLDRELLKSHQYMKMLHLPKFKRIKYFQTNGKDPKVKVGIRIQRYKMEWVPTTNDIPNEIRSQLDDLDDSKDLKLLMERDVKQEVKDNKQILRILPKPDKNFRPFMNYRRKEN